LQEARDNATAMINSAMGGYVVKTQNELLIMDTNDTETATKVWRWNMNGLGYSYNGYKGPYETAITADGRIVADFITTGVLSAVIIKSGILKSLDGSNYFDLEKGMCQFNGTFIAEKDKQKLVLSAAALNYYINNILVGGIDNVYNSDWADSSVTFEASTAKGDRKTILDAWGLTLGVKNGVCGGNLYANNGDFEGEVNTKGKINTESKVVCEGVMASGEVSCKNFVSTGNAYFGTLQSDKINAGGTTRSIGWKQVKDTSGNTIYVLAAT
jgi:cytoskeletal protein CcmA (bactofilin family)